MGTTVHRWLQDLQILVALRAPTLLAAWIARRKPALAPSPIRGILVVRLDGIGDAVLTVPLLESLRRCLPEARITVLTREEQAGIFRMSPAVDEVLTLPRVERRARLQLVAAARAALRFARTQLKGRHFDAALNPRWDVDVRMATLLTVLSGAPIRIGYEDATSSDRLRFNRGFHRAFTHVLPAGPSQHEALRSAALAQPLGCTGAVPALRLVPGVDAPPALIHLLSTFPALPLVAMALPAAEPKRRWPAQSFLATIHAIRRTRPVSIVIFSDEATRSTAETICHAVPEALHLERLSLPEVAAALARCKVFLGGDTGLGHIASAVGCAMVTLSPHPEDGDPAHSNSPDRFRPFTDRAILLRPAHGRSGCEQGCDADEPHCILDIAPERAASAVIELLKP